MKIEPAIPTGDIPHGGDPTVVSLSSIPPRFSTLGPTLQSLLNQSLSAAEIRLNIPRRYRRFPDWDGCLPEVPTGVRIVRTDEDFGPASKVLPTVYDLEGQAVDILFCDDDMLLASDWHAKFKADRILRPNAALVAVGQQITDIPAVARPSNRLPRAQRRSKTLAYRLWRAATLTMHKPHPFIASGYVDILCGFGGVMVRPEFFDAKVFDIPEVLWTVDDPWLSGHLERRGVPIWLNHRHRMPRDGQSSRQEALFHLVVDGHNRGAADYAVIRHMRDRYGIWRTAVPKDTEQG